MEGEIRENELSKLSEKECRREYEINKITKIRND